jgi:hypothetical protein
MPFRSKAQMAAAFSGGLGAAMKKKAPAWANETPNPKALPKHVKKGKKRKRIGAGMAAMMK